MEKDRTIDAFKRRVKIKAIAIGIVLILVVLLTGHNEMFWGLFFGLCIGMINFNIMTYSAQKTLMKPDRSGQKLSVAYTGLRFLILIGAAVAIGLRKGLHPLSALAGFVCVYAAMILEGLVKKSEIKNVIKTEKAE